MTPEMNDLTEICIYENVCGFHSLLAADKASEQTNIVDRSVLLDIPGRTSGYAHFSSNRFLVADCNFLPFAGWCKMLLLAQSSRQEDSMGKLQEAYPWNSGVPFIRQLQRGKKHETGDRAS